MSRVPGTAQVYPTEAERDHAMITFSSWFAIVNRGQGITRDHENLMRLTFRHEPWCGCLRDREAAA